METYTGKRIFFLDLDETLLQSDRTVSPGNKAMLHRAADEGHIIVIASGRSRSSISHILAALELERDGCYVASCNGSDVWECGTGRQIRNLTLPPETARILYREAKKAGIHIHSYSDTQILAEQKTPLVDEYVRRAGSTLRLEPAEETLARTLPKVLMIDPDHDRLAAFRAAHEEQLSGKCEIFFSTTTYLEFCPPHATKGDCVHFLCEYLKMPAESTVAFGDEENDLSMIREAHIGIAMRNAVPQVLKAADRITEYDNNHDGVAREMERYLL